MAEIRHRGPRQVKSNTQSGKTTHEDDASSSISAPLSSSQPLLFGVSAFACASLLLLLPLRLSSARWMPIQDCDETFNYWEPLHHLMFGRGLQTWEYSPLYGLRSYLYLWLISPVAWAIKWYREAQGTADGQTQQEVDKTVLFYAIRFSFALVCSLVETRLLVSIRRTFGAGLARWTLLFLACSAGMGHAATAFLPQTFTMISGMVMVSAWMNREYSWAIFFTGVCSLIGWPFSALLSLPLALEVLYTYRGMSILKPVWWGLVSVAVCVLPSLLVDHFYYRRFIFAVVNIALYNSNAASDHGANLFGREPASFYFVNLFLNFNIAAGLALVMPIIIIVARQLRVLQFSVLSLLRLMSPFYLWFLIFVAMPHKEERFLFVVYPYICICAAASALAVTQILRGAIEASRATTVRRWIASIFIVGVVAVFTTLSAARTASLIINYRAPVLVWTQLHERAWSSIAEPESLPFPYSLPSGVSTSAPSVDVATPPTEVVPVCVGKEWYRFSTAFFTPTVRLARGGRPLEFKLRFLDSDFGGLLPKDFIESWEQRKDDADQDTAAMTKLYASLPHASSRPGTYLTPTGMNRDNRKDDSGRFVAPEICAYVVDLALPGAQQEPLFDAHEVRFDSPQTIGGRCVAGYRWEVAYSAPFLDAANSHSSLLRAFYVPGLSDERNVMKPYQLLQRYPLPCEAVQAQTQTQQ